MNDETPSEPGARRTGSGFYVPGTHDVVSGDDHTGHLQHCAHCGATLSADSEFCRVCAVAVSGGEPAADAAAAGAAATDAPAPADKPAP
ncbi:MAG: hypothetical protein ABR941_08655 [Thermoleophilia bacterium]